MFQVLYFFFLAWNQPFLQEALVPLRNQDVGIRYWEIITSRPFQLRDLVNGHMYTHKCMYVHTCIQSPYVFYIYN